MGFHPLSYYSGKLFKYGIPLLYENMAVVVSVDSKGRILIPKEVREKTGLKPGTRVVLEVKGEVVLLKAIRKDPSEELDEILGDFEFTRRDRIEAERLLKGEVRG